MLNVVVINGGRGAATVIPELLAMQGINLTSVVNAYDDGKSTGEIRRFFGMLGPSDIRKVQELMLPESDPDHTASLNLFRYRYGADCDRTRVLADLRAFADGDNAEIVGLAFKSDKIRSALRMFVREFLDGLSLSEKTLGEEMSFADCSIMNCLFAGAHLLFKRNFEVVTRYFNRLFKLKGTVLPTSIENKKLVALRENGEMLYCEAEIVELRSNVRIERIYLLDDSLDRDRFSKLSVEEKRYFLEKNHCFVEASDGVKLALRQADIILYSAGTQHSSLYPTYLSHGLAAAIADNKSAYKVFVTNIGADYETPSYQASDYILGAYRYLGLADERPYAMRELFDTVLVNRSSHKDDETYVVFDEPAFDEIPVRLLLDSFESAACPGKHDGRKVIETVLRLYDEATIMACAG